MKKWQKLALTGLIGLGSLGLFNHNNAQAQPKNIRVVDTILYGIDSLKNKAGIPNLKVKWNDLEFKTNQEGYIDFLTDVNDKDKNENQGFLKITKQNNSLNFNFDGEASLKIYDLLGREVFNKDNSYENIAWNLENLSNGFYAYELRKKDKTERGALIANFGSGKSEIYLKKNSRENVQENSEKKNLNVSSKLEKIAESVNLSIKDENNLSLDGKSNLGEYFDVEANYSTADSVPNVIHMIPNLSFDSKEYRNILHFVKYMTETDGSNLNTILLRWYFKDLPIKIFRNSIQAPNQNYVSAFDSAISSNAPNSWETMTSFYYKGINLPKMNLFNEVSVMPDTGATMDYSENGISHVIPKWYGPVNGWPRGPPYFDTVYIDNSIIFKEFIMSDTKHEFGHVLFSSIKHSLDSKHAIIGGGGLIVSKDEGKSIRIIYSLPDLQDMKIYKEN